MEINNDKISKVQTNPEFVDLGLSVLWCNYNLEAEKVTDTGIYLAFGEVVPKKTYSERTYICNGYKDAATCEGVGRIPTKQEWCELKTKCKWEFGMIGKTEGVFITGPNDNVIFIPNTGKMEKNKRIITKEVFCWSSDGMVLNYNNAGSHIMSESAYNGCTIRSVQNK